MKTGQTPHRRALAALVPATLLIAASAGAQDAAPIQTTTNPPPVPGAAVPAARPAVTPLTDGVAARNGIGDPESPTPIAPEAITPAEAARAARPRATVAVREAAPARTAALRAAPVAPGAAPVTTAAAPTTVAPTPVVPPSVTEAAPTQADTTTSTAAETTTTDSGSPVWPWIVGALVVLGGLLAMFLRRRNRDDIAYEATYDEPVVQDAVAPATIAPVVDPAADPIVAPPIVHAAPPLVATQVQSQGHSRLEPQFLRPAAVPPAAVVAEQAVGAELVEPEAQEVAALIAGSDHGDRPWLEFAFRPVRAGGTVDDALVEIELTVGNSGAVAARDVRISTFMLADGSASRDEMDALLDAHRANGEVAPVTIEPGEGTRIDATLSLPRAHFGDAGTFNPVIMADARYRMTDGTEGRTSAAFIIGGVGQGDVLSGIDLHGAGMSDAIAARLHGDPQHR